MNRLKPAEIKAALASVPLWRRDRHRVTRLFLFENFRAAMQFVNAVARLAEKAGHHPDMEIRWNRVTLSLSTHDAGGLTAKDFALARQVDALAD